MALQVHQFPALKDNYGYLLHDPESGETAAIDTPEVAVIERALAEKGWTLTHIWNTHHHWDHAGGNLELKEKTGCKIIGPRQEEDKIPGIDQAVGEGDVVRLGNLSAKVYDMPGHTLGHIVYHFESEQKAFVGDVLFPMGCGRLFEGTPAMMWSSMQKILAWPDDTVIYCAHEYTLANVKFALTVEANNPDLQARAEVVKVKRDRGEWTVPTTLAEEKATNPFLRPSSVGLQKNLGMEGAPLADVFAETRARKDKF